MGVSGLFQQSLMVHSRENEACYCCGSKILKKKLMEEERILLSICQKPEPIVVAITGCMGSGKSEVIDYLTQKVIRLSAVIILMLSF